MSEAGCTRTDGETESRPADRRTVRVEHLGRCVDGVDVDEPSGRHGRLDGSQGDLLDDAGLGQAGAGRLGSGVLDEEHVFRVWGPHDGLVEERIRLGLRN